MLHNVVSIVIKKKGGDGCTGFGNDNLVMYRCVKKRSGIYALFISFTSYYVKALQS